MQAKTNRHYDRQRTARWRARQAAFVSVLDLTGRSALDAIPSTQIPPTPPPAPPPWPLADPRPEPLRFDDLIEEAVRRGDRGQHVLSPSTPPHVYLNNEITTVMGSPRWQAGHPSTIPQGTPIAPPMAPRAGRGQGRISALLLLASTFLATALVFLALWLAR